MWVSCTFDMFRGLGGVLLLLLLLLLFGGLEC